MKILDVAESYSKQGGGVRTYIQQKFVAAAAAGHELVVLAPGSEDGEESVRGGKIVWLRGPRSSFDSRYGFFSSEQTVHRAIAREDPDILEGSSPWNGGRFAGSYHGRAKKAFIFHTDPVAVWPQTFLGNVLGFDRVDQLFGSWWRRLHRLANAYDTTVVAGHWLAQRLHRFGIAHTDVVPFGIDKQCFSPNRRDLDLRAHLLGLCGLPPSAKLLVSISRLDPEKRISTLIDGFLKASRQTPMGLVIFGRGALQGWYARKAARSPGVHLHGYVSDRDTVARALASADAFLHGSAAETFGLAVAEAICSGVPVVVPDRGGAAALAGPEFAARYGAGDADGCSAAILELMGRDPAQLARACRRASEEISTMDDHFAGLFGLYESMLEPNRRTPRRSHSATPLQAAS